MPESNGRENWTAVLTRKDTTGFDIHGDGFCFHRSEYPDRARYEADEMRWLIGEISERPDILAYDETKHSGYKPPVAPMAVESDQVRDVLNGFIASLTRNGNVPRGQLSVSHAELSTLVTKATELLATNNVPK